MYYSTWSRAKFHQKWQGKNSSFLLHYLIHIHVLMLCRKFGLIPIIIGFLRIFKVAQKSGKSPCTIVHGLGPNFIKNGREFSILLHFPMYIHVLMLYIKFELIPIIIEFFMNFKSCSKIGQKSLYYSTWSRAKFHQKWQGENSPFLLHFLMYIHVLMLYIKFELILIIIGFFTNF